MIADTLLEIAGFLSPFMVAGILWIFHEALTEGDK